MTLKSPLSKDDSCKGTSTTNAKTAVAGKPAAAHRPGFKLDSLYLYHVASEPGRHYHYADLMLNEIQKHTNLKFNLGFMFDIGRLISRANDQVLLVAGMCGAGR